MEFASDIGDTTCDSAGSGAFRDFDSVSLEKVRTTGQGNRAHKSGANRRSQDDWDAEAEALREKIISQGGIPGYCPERAANIAKGILRRLGVM